MRRGEISKLTWQLEIKNITASGKASLHTPLPRRGCELSFWDLSLMRRGNMSENVKLNTILLKFNRPAGSDFLLQIEKGHFFYQL